VSITARAFQTAALDRVRAELVSGRRAVLLVSPVGSGKTFMGSQVAAGHLARATTEKPRRVVWLAHRTELRQQAADALTSIGLDVGHSGRNVNARVQVCSVQQLTIRREAPDATLVIPDEAHHLAEGNGWTDLLRAYLDAGARIVGLTATPSRADGQSLHGFDAIVVAAQIRELQELGHLVPLTIKRPRAAVRKDRIAQLPVDFYLQYARGRHAVVFAPHVVAAEAYAAGFRGLGIAAEVVTGKTPADERASILERFALGRLAVLVNVGVLTEGWDATICDCVILARGCGSPSLLIQMVGRGLRPHAGKTSCLLGDLRGVTYALGRPDADADYSLTGEGIVLHGAKSGERLCPVCGELLGELVRCPNPACGRDVSMVVPIATGEPLFDWHEVLAADSPDKRVDRLARWIRVSREKGHNPNAVRYKFRAVYGHYPDGSTLAKAARMADETHVTGGDTDGERT